MWLYFMRKEAIFNNLSKIKTKNRKKKKMSHVYCMLTHINPLFYKSLSSSNRVLPIHMCIPGVPRSRRHFSLLGSICTEEGRKKAQTLPSNMVRGFSQGDEGCFRTQVTKWILVFSLQLHKTNLDNSLAPPKRRSAPSVQLAQYSLGITFATKTGLELSVLSTLLDRNKAVWKGSIRL